MHGGDVMTREVFLARLRALDELNDEIVVTVNERRTSDTAQIIVVCQDLVRFLWFSLRDGGASLRQRDSALSRALSQNWQGRLIEAIDSGEREYMQVEHSISHPRSFSCSGSFSARGLGGNLSGYISKYHMLPMRRCHNHVR